jgi:hypothetical protein
MNPLGPFNPTASAVAPPSEDVMKEELATIGPSPGIDFSSHTLKEEYQQILSRNPQWILNLTFTFKLGSNQVRMTPRSMEVDPENSEVFFVCEVIDENGTRIDRFQQESFLEDIYAGNMMPLDDPTAFAAKILLMDSLKKQKA